MTKNDIRLAAITAINELYPTLSNEDELTEAQNVAITDAVAAAMETVNPLKDYPSTAR